MFRIGQSRDIHRLENNNRPLIISGVKFDFEKYEDNGYFDEDQLLDDISDWLSDIYGYCHFDFEIKR